MGGSEGSRLLQPVILRVGSAVPALEVAGQSGARTSTICPLDHAQWEATHSCRFAPA